MKRALLPVVEKTQVSLGPLLAVQPLTLLLPEVVSFSEVTPQCSQLVVGGSAVVVVGGGAGRGPGVGVGVGGFSGLKGFVSDFRFLCDDWRGYHYGFFEFGGLVAVVVLLQARDVNDNGLLFFEKNVAGTFLLPVWSGDHDSLLVSRCLAVVVVLLQARDVHDC